MKAESMQLFMIPKTQKYLGVLFAPNCDDASQCKKGWKHITLIDHYQTSQSAGNESGLIHAEGTVTIHLQLT